MSAQTLGLPIDPNHHAIQAGSTLAVATVTLNASTYVAVTLPAGVSCKSVSAKTRSGNNWYFASSASPTDYMTLAGMLTLSIVANAGETLFYVKGSTSDTLELVYLD